MTKNGTGRGDIMCDLLRLRLVLLKILSCGRHILIPYVITAVSQTQRSIVCITDGQLRTIITLAALGK